MNILTRKGWILCCLFPPMFLVVLLLLAWKWNEERKWKKMCAQHPVAAAVAASRWN